MADHPETAQIINEYSRLRDALVRTAKADLKNLMKEDPVRRAKDAVKKLLGRAVRTRDELFWPQGMLLLGLLEAGEMQAVKDFFDRWLSRGGVVVYPDDALAGYVLVRLYEQTADDKYLEGAHKVAEYLSRTERNEERMIVYQPGKPVQNIAADGAGMAALFLARYAKCLAARPADHRPGDVDVSSKEKINETGPAETASAADTEIANVAYAEECADDARRQVTDYLRCATDAATGLPMHGFDLASGKQKGLAGWGRAASWLLMGMSECGSLDGQTEELIQKVLQYQRDDGLIPWHLPAGDPADTSASGMVAWSILNFEQNGAAPGIEMKQQDAAGSNGADPDMFLEAASRILLGILPQIGNGVVTGSLGESVDFGVHPQNYGHNPWGQGAALAALARYAAAQEGKV